MKINNNQHFQWKVRLTPIKRNLKKTLTGEK